MTVPHGTPDLSALIARLEEAMEGSPILDGEVLYAVRGWRFVNAEDRVGMGLVVRCSPAGTQEGDVNFNIRWPTRLIEEALSLVPNGSDWTLTRRTRHPYQGKWPFEATIWSTRSQGFAPTMPLALCIAALKARMAT